MLDPAGLGHANAFNRIKMWAMGGTVDCWGYKPITGEFVKIEPAEWVSLEADFRISASPDQLFTPINLIRGLKPAYLDVVVDWHQFKRRASLYTVKAWIATVQTHPVAVLAAGFPRD
jgi:hypothetical protein